LGTFKVKFLLFYIFGSARAETLFMEDGHHQLTAGGQS